MPSVICYLLQEFELANCDKGLSTLHADDAQAAQSNYRGGLKYLVGLLSLAVFK
jgi:hypothetical protein